MQFVLFFIMSNSNIITYECYDLWLHF